MKKTTLIKLHLYCGLFVSFYLVAFGVSSVILNHGIDVENKTVTSTWESEVVVDSALEDTDLAENVRNQLGLMGWTPPWRYRKDSGQFVFETTHLAKTSVIHLDMNSGAVLVEDIPKGFWAVFHGLHFYNGRIPNAPLFMKTWIIYQWVTLLVLTFSLVLGLWLWIRHSHKTWELYVFGGLFLVSLLVMMLL